MANVVCLVQGSADRVSFTWSQGPDAFPPFHLVGQHLVILQQQIDEARKCLAALVNAYLDYLHQPTAQTAAAELGAACLGLAKSGYELRRRLFKPSEGERDANDVAKWLSKLREQQAIESIEVVTEGWLPLPWNLLY